MTKKVGTDKKAAKPSSNERRTKPRLGCKLEALCQIFQAGDETAHPARIVDISTGGVGVILNHKFKPKTRLAVKLSTSNSTRTLLGHVVHVTDMGAGCWMFGCAFDSELTAEELRDVLD